MRVLVTGGAGYIGSVTVERLIADGHDVTVIDNLSKGHRLAVLPGARLLQADILDRDRIIDIFRQIAPEAVIHFAAFSLVGESVQQPERYFRNNVVGALNVLDGLLAGSGKTFVFSSTAAVYGTAEQIPIPETAPQQPENPYGATKRAVEDALYWYGRRHELRTVSLRYFNAAGASHRLGEDHTPETHLIPNTLRAAIGQAPELVVFGRDYPTPDGTCVRDYVHVEDLAAAHVLALQAPESRAYNVGTGKGYSVLEILAAAERTTGHAIPHRFGERRAGDPAELVADVALITEELGFRPEHSDLDSILGSAWSWMQRFPKGYAGAQESI